MENLFKAFVNLAIVSIPEELLMVAIALMFLGKRDLLYFKRENAKIFIAVICPAVASNVARYFFGMEPQEIMLIFALVYCTSFIITYKCYTSAKSLFKSFACCMISFFISAVIELLYGYAMFAAIDQTYQQVNDSILINFLGSFPLRIISFTIVLYLIKKKENGIQENLYEVLLSSRLAINTVIATFVLSLVYYAVIVKLFWVDKFLINLEVTVAEQALIVSVLFTVPIIGIIGVVSTIIYYNYKISIMNRNLRLKTAAEIAERFAKSGMYEKMSVALLDIKNNIEEEK